VFTDGIVYERTMLDMQRKEWLAPTICYQVNSTTDLRTVPTVGREYSLRQLNKVVNNTERNELVVQTYLELFPGRQALVFCCSLDHVRSLERGFKSAGVAAAAVLGSTEGMERAKVLKDFKDGRVQVVCNYGVLTEGFDYPELGVIIQARPTQSALLLTQMVGRANRISAGKPAAEVAEIVDRHCSQSTTVPLLFGFPQEFNCEGHNFVECCDLADQLVDEQLKNSGRSRRRNSWNPYGCRSWSAMLMASETPSVQEEDEREEREGEVLHATELRDSLSDFEDIMDLVEEEPCYAFVEVEQEGYDTVLFAEFKDTIDCAIFVLQQEGSDEYGIQIISRLDGRRIHGPSSFSEDYAVRLACAWVRHACCNQDMLYNLSAPWRRHPCTDRQFQALKRSGLVSTGINRAQLSKGSAAELLNEHFVRKSFGKYADCLVAGSSTEEYLD